MKALLRMMLFGLFLSPFHFNSFAQVGIITTYVGPPSPMDGELATTQAMDHPVSVIPDGSIRRKAFGFEIIPNGELALKSLYSFGLTLIISMSGLIIPSNIERSVGLRGIYIQ